MNDTTNKYDCYVVVPRCEDPSYALDEAIEAHPDTDPDDVSVWHENPHGVVVALRIEVRELRVLAGRLRQELESTRRHQAALINGPAQGWQGANIADPEARAASLLDYIEGRSHQELDSIVEACHDAHRLLA